MGVLLWRNFPTFSIWGTTNFTPACGSNRIGSAALSLSGAALAGSSTRQLNRISSPDSVYLTMSESIPQTSWKYICARLRRPGPGRDGAAPVVAGFPAGVAAWAGGAEGWACWADKMSPVPKARMLAATPAASIAFVTGVRLWSSILRFLVAVQAGHSSLDVRPVRSRLVHRERHRVAGSARCCNADVPAPECGP